MEWKPRRHLDRTMGEPSGERNPHRGNQNSEIERVKWILGSINCVLGSRNVWAYHPLDFSVM